MMLVANRSPERAGSIQIGPWAPQGAKLPNNWGEGAGVGPYSSTPLQFRTLGPTQTRTLIPRTVVQTGLIQTGSESDRSDQFRLRIQTLPISSHRFRLQAPPQAAPSVGYIQIDSDSDPTGGLIQTHRRSDSDLPTRSDRLGLQTPTRTGLSVGPIQTDSDSDPTGGPGRSDRSDSDRV